ncbi:MAG: glycosyltransferase [Candidatus Berkelbacteria bacterium]|nr:glycosyltransferase [Candidatus Berkelbacteria bacterium]
MISIITPCKDIVLQGREAFFKKMMQTLQAQTYKDFEHILIDGGSKDGTVELLQKYLEVGLIDTLVSEHDNNLHEAINKGLKIAKGEYIYVMNTDNYFSTSKFFERSLEALEKHHVDYTHGDRIIIRRDGEAPYVKKGDERVAYFRMPFRWQTMLIRRKVYDKFGPFDEKYEIASDYKFMLKMLLAGTKGYYFPEIFIYSLDGGITTDRKKCVKEVSSVIFESYGKKNNLTIVDCKSIYQRRITPKLYAKLTSEIKDDRILKSLKYCYEYENTTNSR